MRILKNKSIRSGETTGVSTGKLVDSSAQFISGSWPVRIGDVVLKEVDDANNVETIITALDSDTTLSLRDDIFTGTGQRYRILIGDIDLMGTTTGSSSKKLVDSSANFLASGVRSGMLALNRSNGLFAWVETVSSTELGLSKNIFSSGQPYRVYSGETFFEREYDELRLRRLLIAGDDTEVSTTSSSPVDLKKLHCVSSSAGYLLTGLRFVYEAKCVGGTLALTTTINGATIGTNYTSGSSYAVYTLAHDYEYTDGTVLEIKILGSVSAGTGYLRVTEVYAIV